MELSDSHKISQEKRDFKISDVLITAWSRVQVLAGPCKKHEGFGLRASFAHSYSSLLIWPFLFAPIAADPAFCRKLHQIPPFAQ
ncbi:MAG: hypothetical protein ACLSTW_00530 [Faecalibacterium sp.]